MKYFLAKMTLGCKARKEIPEDHFAQIRRHKSNLIRALEIEERFHILLSNYVEFEEEVVGRSIEHNLYAKRVPHQMDDDRIALNRRITNLLSSCRLYLDQLMHSIKDIFGDGAELTEVRDLAHTQYDNSLSYRLMEAVRNFVQHRGLAASSYSVSHTTTQEGENSRVACTVTPQLVCKDLASDPKVTAKVKNELNKLPPSVDLKPHVRSYIEALWRIHSGVRSILSDGCSEWEETIEDAVAEFKTHVGIQTTGVPLGLAIIHGESEYPYTIAEKHDVFFGFIERRKLLEEKNVVNQNLATRFATGQESALLKTNRRPKR